MNATEMQAGRELDALVAERVMGFRWRDVRVCGETNRVRVLLHTTVMDIDGRYSRANLDLPRHPDYSQSIDAAWVVVERMVSGGDGYDFELTFESGVWSCWFPHATYDAGQAYADTAPLAICRAALAAVAP